MLPNVILTEDDLHAAVEYFLQFDEFAFDTEGRGPSRSIPAQTEVTWLSMATHGAGVVIPFGHINGCTRLRKATRKKNRATGKFEPVPAVYTEPPQQLPPSVVFDALRPLFFSDRTKIGMNLPFDIVSVIKYFGGDIVPPPYRDIGVAQWLADENFRPMVYSPRLGRSYPSPRVGLKEMTEHYFGVRYDEEEVGRNIDHHTFDVVARYSYLDAVYTWLLDRILLPKLEEEGVTSPFYDLEMPVAKALMRMAKTGCPVDMDALMPLQKELSEVLIQQEGEVYKAAGRKFTIGSPPQRQQVLYSPVKEGGQGLKPKRLTDKGRAKQRRGKPLELSDYSTDNKSLEMHPENEVVKALNAHAETSKLLSGFLNSWLGDPENDVPRLIFNGYIHPQFKQHGAVTGRFSCSKPNAQQIPRPGKPLATKIRGLVKAPSRWLLTVADYSQIELRVLAHYIGSGGLYEGFLEGVDAHTATAALIFGVKWEDVAPEQRQIAKGCNFCIIYGGGPETLAGQAGITVKQAKKVLEKHAQAFPEIHQFTQRVVARCRNRETPYVTTLLGRKRRIPEIDPKQAKREARRMLRGEPYNEKQLESAAWRIRSKAERQAVNSLIQGSAADLAKLALVRLDDAFEADFAHHGSEEKRISTCLTVHDEFVCLTPEDRAQHAAGLVEEAMVGDGIQKLIRVPLTTDVKTVASWDLAK